MVQQQQRHYQQQQQHDNDDDDHDDNEETKTVPNNNDDNKTNTTSSTSTSTIGSSIDLSILVNSLQQYTAAAASAAATASAGGTMFTTTTTTTGTTTTTPKLTYKTFTEWAETTAPQLAATMATFFHVALLGPLFLLQSSTSLSNNNNNNNDHDYDDDDNDHDIVIMKRNPLPFSFPHVLHHHHHYYNKNTNNTNKQHEPKGSFFWNVKDPVFSNNIPFALAIMAPCFNGAWHRLFTTEDGFAFGLLQQALLSYSGPTVMLIQTTPSSSLSSSSAAAASTFGYYTATPWRSAKTTYYGSTDSFLFRLAPHVNVYPPQSLNMNNNMASSSSSPTSSPIMMKPRENFMYLNPSTDDKASTSRNRMGVSNSSNRNSNNRNRNSSNSLYGLAVDGMVGCPRLFLSESFEQCRADSMGSTYESGPLLLLQEGGEGDLYFNVDVLEVWAVDNGSGSGSSIGSNSNSTGSNGDERIWQHIQQGQKLSHFREAQRQRAARVDRTLFLEDFQSGIYLNTLYQHREMTRGRHSFSVDDVHGGYTIERSNHNHNNDSGSSNSSSSNGGGNETTTTTTTTTQSSGGE